MSLVLQVFFIEFEQVVEVPLELGFEFGVEVRVLEKFGCARTMLPINDETSAEEGYLLLRNTFQQRRQAHLTGVGLRTQAIGGNRDLGPLEKGIHFEGDPLLLGQLLDFFVLDHVVCRDGLKDELQCMEV